MANTSQFNNIMDQFDGCGLLRPVVESPMYLPNGDQVPGKKALLFDDDKSYISTVGSKYQIIQNQEVYESVAMGLVQSGLDLNGLSVKSVGSEQSRHFAMITLPEHRIFKGTSDETQMQIISRNSHDGTWKQQIDVGAIRVACLNGQVTGDLVTAYSNAHRSSYDIDSLSTYMSDSVSGFDEMGGYWRKLMNVKLQDDDAKRFIFEYLDKSISNEFDHDRAVKSKRYGYLLGLWNAYKREMGMNAYALYNAFTDDATHFESKSPAQAMKNRQAKVSSVANNILAHA